MIIWLLLFGQHPFTGKWIGSGEPLNIDELIRQGYWQYTPNSKIRISPHSIPLNIVDSNIQYRFYECFVNGHTNPYVRPSAADWVNTLKSASENLQTCGVEASHRYTSTYGRCYWCERKSKLGRDIFPTTQPKNPKISTSPVPTSPVPTSPVPTSPGGTTINPRILLVGSLIVMAIVLRVLGIV
ncbi:MAG: hypothetical protein HC764_21950 [Pleurocapsa sp. CRU_1_2]|nr:hypothetical protein [Pleurocapsa sp. CRU_1_2]